MSYHPQVGDRVTEANLEDEGTVLYVHGGQAVVVFDGDDGARLYRFNELVKVEPRPKVREQSIRVTSMGHTIDGGPANARIVAKTVRLVGTAGGHWSTVAVVTDLDGNPLEVQT